MYENLVYNKENISNKWEKDDLLNRFSGEMSNHLEKIRSIAHTVCTNYRWINLNKYFLTCYKKISENIFIILNGERFPTYGMTPRGHNGK